MNAEHLATTDFVLRKMQEVDELGIGGNNEQERHILAVNLKEPVDSGAKATDFQTSIDKRIAMTYLDMRIHRCQSGSSRWLRRLTLS